jgi:hypothetical protein
MQGIEAEAMNSKGGPRKKQVLKILQRGILLATKPLKQSVKARS